MAETPNPVGIIPDEILHGTRQEIERKAQESSSMGQPQRQPDVSQPTVAPRPQGHTSQIEDLLMFGHVSHEADILGRKFVVKTLCVSEKEQAYSAVAHLPASSFVHFFNLRDELLSRAIESVNGLPLISYYRPSPDDPAGMTDDQKKVAVVKKMHGPIVDKLHELYNILEENATNALSEVSFDSLKNS